MSNMSNLLAEQMETGRTAVTAEQVSAFLTTVTAVMVRTFTRPTIVVTLFYSLSFASCLTLGWSHQSLDILQQNRLMVTQSMRSIVTTNS